MRKRRTRLRLASYFTILFSFGLFLTPSVLEAQSLQWSQFTSPNIVTGPTGRNFTSTIRKAADGSIYTLSQGQTGLGIPPAFSTTNVVYYGNFTAGNNQANRFAYLSKYSADGNTLLWVRVLAPQAPTNTTVALTPLDMDINPLTGELVVLCLSEGNPVASALITNDAQLPNPPDYTQYSNNQRLNSALVINKFSNSGALNYGSYLANPAGGSHYIAPDAVQSSSARFLEISSDGSIYVFFRIRHETDVGTHTGVIPTTAGALATSPFGSNIVGTNNKVTSFFTILNPNNTVRYATYYLNEQGLASPYNGKMAPNGDFYLILDFGGGAQLLKNHTVPSNAAFTEGGSIILRINSAGVIVGSTKISQTSNLSIRPNGNVITVLDDGSLIEFNAALTSVINKTIPFPSKLFKESLDDIELDAEGRLHFITYTQDPTTITYTTPGALNKSSNRAAAYYGILDCNLKDIVYATEIKNANPVNYLNTTRFIDLEISGCTAYMVGLSSPGVGFPVTPSAYNEAGTATVSGYKIAPLISDNAFYDGVMMAFNYPVQKANTNVLTAPAVTNICKGGATLPIDGTATTFLTPTVIGFSASNPVPTPTHYQWQIGTSNTGPWTDIADSDKEDFSPTSPTVAGTYYYRRLVRQTPFEKGFCAPSCDESDASNIISLAFSGNNTHSTNILEGKYGICKGGTALALSVNINQSVDGAFAPYTYKLTTTSNLVTTVFGQSGSVASVATPISLSVSTAGDYILQVTDSRGCVSFDTLNLENLKLDAGSTTKYTCGDPSVKLGIISLPGDYLNYPTNTFLWSSASGLDDANAAKPIFTHGLAIGDSTVKYLTFNGCLVDSVKIINEAITALPSLPDLAVCQGDTVRLGTDGVPLTPTTLLTAQSGVTYEWGPGLGLVSNTVLTPLVTTIYAPQGVNPITYTLLATSGTSGCVQTTTQKVTTYRYPNQSFSLKDCMKNGCTPTSTLQHEAFGTDPEPGISYSWTATVIDNPANVGNTGLPTNAEALSFLVNPTSSKTSLNSNTPGLGYAAMHGYKIVYVRTSYNTASPICMRTDTAELYYCCGSGIQCDLALGNVPTITCGGPDNKIGSTSSSSSGYFYWTRVDGQPLNNELFEIGTNTPLSNTGPHPFNVIGNPSGFVAVDYRLTFIRNPSTGSPFDTCTVDIRVFPGAVAKPNVVYPDNQSLCQGSAYTIQGSAGQPAYTYLWSPTASFLTPADTAKALPTLKVANRYSAVYVTVTDPTTGCYAKDTVNFAMTAVDVDAGADASFCISGATVNIGALIATAGYTYQWTAVPAAGVTFGNATLAQTTATLPATAAASTIKLYLTATNTLTASNCALTDSLTMTAAAAPTITIPATNALCTTGGTVTIGPITPSNATTYAWAGPGIVSGNGTTSIVVNATGTYTVTVTQGTCSATATRAIAAATNPTVTLAPAAPCASNVTIGATTMTTTQKVGWSFTWDKFDAMTANATDFSNITVRPTVTTTYTLTATHSSGCVRTYAVVVPAATYAASLPSTLNFCEGQAAVLPLNDPSSVSGTVAWTASPTTGLAYLSSPTAVNPIINMTTAVAGTYTYTATVTYPTGCTSTASVTVNIGKKPENQAGLDQEICLGKSVTLGTTSVLGTSYEWSATPTDSTLTTPNIAQPVVTPSVNTTYTLKTTDNAGCKYTDNVAVNILSAPTLTVEDTLAVCQNATGTATVDLSTAILTNTGTTTTYWQNSGLTIAATNPVTYPSLYYIKSENASGCSVSAPTRVLFYDLPVGTVIADFNCTTKKGSLSISSTTTNVRYDYNTGATYTGGKTYATATALSTGGTIVNNLPAPPVAGQTYTVRFFGSDGLCFVDKTTTVSAAACPCDTTLTVSNTTTCNGTAVNLFTLASGVKGTLTYSTDGTTWTALANPTNVTPSVSTTYFVKDSLVAYCFDIDTLTITVIQPVTAGVGTNPTTATCQAGSGLANINLAAQITGATVGGTWSQTSGTAVGTALNTTTGVFNPNGIAVGTYTFRYTVVGTSPCPNDTEDIMITIENCCPPSICIPVTVTRN